MTLKLNMSPSEISSRFGSIDRDKIEGYRDATFSAPDFFLELSDCWSAIGAAVKLHWLSLPHPNLWGMIDMEEYVQYDNALNGDLHEVVPGKFEGPWTSPAAAASPTPTASSA